MSEKRKPCLVMLLRKQGKKGASKVEVFHASEWYKEDRKIYRIRVNGKWLNDKNGKKMFIEKYKFRDILFRSILK